MTVHAGDTAIYRQRSGKQLRVLVHGHTAKRVRIVVPEVKVEPMGNGASYTHNYSVRYVKAEHLERVAGGGLLNADDPR